MREEPDRSVLVHDAEEDTWAVFDEPEVQLLDPGRYTAEWVFDRRAEAEQMLERALEATPSTPTPNEHVADHPGNQKPAPSGPPGPGEELEGPG